MIGDFVISNALVVRKVQYNPHDALPHQGEVDTNNDDFEYIELSNTGIAPIDLGGMQFVQVDVDRELQGINFTFDTQLLNPSEQIVVVKNRAAFESRYVTNVRIADGEGGNNGEFADQLSNRGELVKLVLPSGISLFSFDYEDRDRWPQRADGFGSSLELIDPLEDSNDPATWRSSAEHGGSPGSEGIGNTGSVIVNEVLTNTPTPVDDAIEFYNPTTAPINIGGMWLSDRLSNLDRFVIPSNTFIPPAGYLVLDENDFDFGLSGNVGEDIVLFQPDAFENPDLFVDHVSFGPALVSESFGRWPDEAGILYPMISTTLGSANSGPRAGPVVISEVMYNPPESDFLVDSQLLEFIEIYNPTPSRVDLTEWIVDGIGYQFPVGVMIDPGRTLTLVPFNPAGTMSDAFKSFQKTYDLTSPAAFPAI